VTCAEVRFALGAEPPATTALVEAHLRECAACAEYRREMIELEQKIRAALNVTGGAPGSSRS
jgi:predicted anti-sigma-YlaC factor YlaD